MRFRIAAIVILVVLAGGGAVCAWLFIPFGPAAEDFREPIAIEIKRGTSTRTIAEELEGKEIITSKWRFLAIRALRRSDTLMAGYYRFARPMTAWDAFEALREGSVRYYPVTIPEGFNRFEIAEAVSATGLMSKQEFVAATDDVSMVKEQFPEARNLEGFLFPDTYYLDETSTPAKVVATMTEQFRTVFREATRQASSDLKPYQLLILASMIEKETSESEEHDVVSSVFQNRLRLRMPMQCDPTVIYGLMVEDRYRGRLLTADLEDPHPYNTYVHGGLPPGPIANPGRKALLAAAKPAETGFLFFVAKGDGAGHVFSKDLIAHNRAVAAYRRSLGR
ncbi:MAG: endolytic transglycosylase MltG [Acidobacteria bacterium]|nr:endolytic transglycosylase MltG [Acidobacteriota bacterium]